MLFSRFALSSLDCLQRLRREAWPQALLVAVCLASPLAAPDVQAQAASGSLRLGAGKVDLAPRSADAAVPPASYRTGEAANKPAPSNQWFSSLIYSDKPEALYAQPLTIKPVAGTVEVALPRKQVVPTERQDVEIHYPHRDALVFSPTAFQPGRAQLMRHSDWAIDFRMAQGDEHLDVTAAHGSPYVWLNWSRGDMRVKLPAPAERISTSDSRQLVLQIAGSSSASSTSSRYALFGPSGVIWEQVSASDWLAKMPASSSPGKAFLSVAALPDASPASLTLLARHAYSQLVDTRADWQVDAKTGEVLTRFSARTRALEGEDAGALMALYPHHWHGNASVQDKLGPAYDSVRGPLKLLAASSFQTRSRYNGFVPYWPGISEHARLSDLRDVMKSDMRNARRMMLENGQGPYWQGKGLLRIVKLLDVVEQQGDQDAREQLLKLLKGRVEEWFSGEDRRRYFHWDQKAGTVVAYPEEYFSVVQMNDHHFHYGYWIRAIAEIALRDPAWAASERWGAMVDLLVKDIATAERSRSDFPFLRNFDVYEGHSWASGIGLGETGNNQESSSEALNAWTGLILWGEIKGDPALRDLGIWLLATETESVQHYWFDLHKLVLAPEYRNPDVSMVFGGKYAHNTWWIDEPRQITGINLLPITTVSTYFARDPAYVRRNLAALQEEEKVWAGRGKKFDPPDVWQDIFAKYLALADPAAALVRWNRWGAVEFGDSRSHTLHFLLSLSEMGTPDLSVTADTPLFQVFQREGKRMYLAFNAGRQPITVRFSDGQQLNVPPGQLARTRQP